MSGELKEVYVTDLYVTCTYPEPHTYQCWRTATSAVKRSDGARTWRCDEHRGLLREGEESEVYDTVLTTRDLPEAVVVSRISR